MCSLPRLARRLLPAVLLFQIASATAAEPAARTVKVAAVQCSAQLGENAANTAKLTALIRDAAAHGAKIVVLPEAAITGYLSQDGKTNWHLEGRPIEKEFTGKDPSPFAETVPGTATRHFCKLAGELGIYLTIPFVEIDRGIDAEKPRYFNTVCLADPHGKMVLHYRKIAPWPHPEKSWATPGDRGLQTFDTEYGRVGLAICFDIHNTVEKYRDKNLWALLYPIAWAHNEHPAEWFYHELPERVKTFRHHLIGANWSVDEHPAWYGYGFSTIISREGKVLASAHSLHGSAIVYAELPVAK